MGVNDTTNHLRNHCATFPLTSLQSGSLTIILLPIQHP